MELSKVFPIQSIEDNIIVNGQGDLTIGFSLLLPEMFTLKTEDYDIIHEALVNIISKLPIGTVLHKQDFYYLDRFNYTVKEDITYSMKQNVSSFTDRPILRHHSYIFLTFSSNQKISVDGSRTSLISVLDWVIKKPFKDLDNLITKVNLDGNNFINAMSSIPSLVIKRMDTDQLADAVYNYFSLSYAQPKNNVWDLKLPDVDNAKGYCKIGNQFMSLISLYEEGASVSNYKENTIVSKPEVFANGVRFCDSIKGSSMVYPITLGLPIDHIVNTTIEVVDNEDMANHLTNISKGLNLFTAFSNQGAIDKKEDIKDYITSASKYHHRSCKTSLSVIVHDANFDVLQNKISHVETAFSNMNGSKIQLENKHLLNCFFSTIPGNAKFVYKFLPHVVRQAICYLPIETHYRNDKSGVLFVDRYGAPVIVNLWNPTYPNGSDKITNRNKVIFGPSGSGKSFLVNNLVDQCLFAGHHVIIIDIGRSYEKLCRLYDGAYMDSADKSKFSFNLFSCPQDKDGNFIFNQKDKDGEGEFDRINFIYSVLVTIWKGNAEILNETKGILKNMIVCFYDYVNRNKIHPTLFEFNKFCVIYEKEHIEEKRKKFFDFDSFELIMEPFVSGTYAYLLNSPENVNLFHNKFVVFELESIKGNKELFPVMCILIIELVMDKLRGLDERIRKTFLIDEALDFLKSDMGEFIAYLYRTIRKKGGEVYLAAQNIEFLEECSETVRKSIMINTDTKILLDHSKNRNLYPSMKSILSLNNSDLDLVDSLQDGKGYREFFLKLGNESKIFRNEVSEYAGTLYSTTPEVVAELTENFKKIGNMNAVINQYIEKKHSQI